MKVWKLACASMALWSVCCGAESDATDLPGQGGATQGGAAGTTSGAGGVTAGTGGVGGATGGSASGGNGGGGGGSGFRCIPVPAGEPLAQVLATPVIPLSAALGSVTVEMDEVGRVLIAGYSRYSPLDIFVARLLPDGSLDPDFSNDGEFTLSRSDSLEERVQALEIDAEGRIWIAGSAEVGADQPTSAFVARLLDGGFLDTSFNLSGPTSGILMFRPRGEGAATVERNASVRSLAFSSAGTLVNGAAPVGFLERFLEDGSPDPNFNVTSVTFDGVVQVLGDTLFMLNAAYTGPALSAWTLDGAPRADFGSEGRASLREAFDPVEILETAEGRLLLFTRRATVARLDASGTLDTAFGTNGYTTSTDCIATDVALLCDGTIVAVGYNIRPFPDPYRFCAVAYTPEGDLLDGAPVERMYSWEPPDLITSQTWLFLDPTGHIVALTDRDGYHLERYAPPWATP